MKKWNPATIQSPLARARGYGSAHHGAHHWMLERMTSLALIPLMLWLVFSVAAMPGTSYAEFTAWQAQPLNAVLMILSILIGFYHAALGCQVIVEDYIHLEWFKLAKIIGIKFFFFAAGTACILAVLKIAFTAG